MVKYGFCAGVNPIIAPLWQTSPLPPSWAFLDVERIALVQYYYKYHRDHCCKAAERIATTRAEYWPLAPVMDDDYSIVRRVLQRPGTGVKKASRSWGAYEAETSAYSFISLCTPRTLYVCMYRYSIIVAIRAWAFLPSRWQGEGVLAREARGKFDAGIWHDRVP